MDNEFSAREMKQIDKLRYLLQAYNDVISLLVEHQDDNGISRISQPEIAKRLKVSQTAIAKRFKNLMKFGAVKKLEYRNAYKVVETDLYNHSPLGLLVKLILLLQNHPELIDDYYKQAEYLQVSYHDVQVARGYLSFVMN